MNELNFMKIQANGNDFICLEGDHLLDKRIIQSWCKRHYGIGGDGVLLIEKSKKVDCFMRVYNSDGSEATLCGNGLFCVAEYYKEKHGCYPKTIDTLSGMKHFIIDEEGLWMAMGNGKIESEYGGIKVDIGNQHLVIFEKNITDERILNLGKEYQNIYADGINVELCSILSKESVLAKVYERGVGLSMSCGSGACAIFIAFKHVNPGLRKLYVHFDGGTLCVKEVEGILYLQSKAKIIYKGETYD